MAETALSGADLDLLELALAVETIALGASGPTTFTDGERTALASSRASPP